MKPSIVALLVLASFACAENIKQLVPGNSAFGYLESIGIPEAERIRQAETRLQSQRIIGGNPAVDGQFEYQVGLLISIIGLNGRGVCGGSLVTANRVITAAHCWFDGIHQGYNLEVVLGSAFLYSGGTRIETSSIVVHPNWFPLLVRNDVAVINLPRDVSFSNTIGPIALPSGSELNEDFAGETAIASGFGRIVDGGSISGGLNYVTLNVISNSVCRLAFPLILQESNICTSGLSNVGTCQGDSGGPLVINRNGKRIMIGITSFGSGLGCESFLPASYVRVTSFIDFFNSNL